MTTLAQLAADVYRVTNRPDLTNETYIAIRAATLRFHMADDWVQSEATSVVPVVPLFTGDFRYSFLTTSLTRFRKIKYIKEYVTPPNPWYIQFERLAPDDLLDGYQTEKENYWTRIGNGISLRATREISNLEVVYYQLPDVSEATYSSWIADMFQDCIIHEAKMDIFEMTGKVASDSRARNLKFTENLALLRQMAVVE